MGYIEKISIANPRYLLWMLENNINEIPASHHNFIVWIQKMGTAFNRSENEKDFDIFLMKKVREKLSQMAVLPPVTYLGKVNRVEVIDQNGRSYVNWKPTNKTELSLQDDGKTLKVFISKRRSKNDTTKIR